MFHPLWKSYFKENWPIYLVGFFALMLTSSMQAFTVRIMGWVIDFFNEKPLPNFLTYPTKQETFMALFWCLLLAHLILTFGRGLWRITFARQTFYSQSMLRSKVWDRVRKFPLDIFKTKYTKGYLLNINTSEIMTASFIFGFSLVGLCDAIMLFSSTLIAMLTINVPISLYSILLLSFLPWAVYKLSRKEVQAYDLAQQSQEALNDFSAHAVETIKLQKVTNTLSSWFDRFFNLALDKKEKRLTTSLVNNQYSIVIGSASLVTIICLFVIGVQKTLTGEMTIGDFVAIQGLVFLLHSPLIEMGAVISEFRKGNYGLGKIAEILAESPDSKIRDGINVDQQNFQNVFEVTNLSFSYNGHSPVFSDLSFKLPKGEWLGILGPIGSGKTTLAKALTQLIDVNFGADEGKIKLFDIDINEYSSEFIHKNIILVNQTPFIFAKTVRDNIALDSELSDDEVWSALAMAGFDIEVKSFKDQLNTVLGEMGINLSGGQKQRLALARAFARKPNILIIDDSLSAVDTMTEEIILTNIQKYLKGTTILWIAHRASTLKYCHQIINLGSGEGHE